MSPDSVPNLDGRPKLLNRVINLTIVLLLIGGVTVVSTSAGPAVFETGRLAILIGFVLLVASVAGSLASSASLPRLTGFIVVGIVAGPSLLGIIPESAVDDLHLIDQFALALIAMLAGGELKIQSLKPQARTIAYSTLLITGIVWVGTAGVVVAMRPLIPFLAELPFSATVGVALLLGVWAANSSPDLTVAVIEETKVRGPLADVILGTTIVKDVVVIVFFTLTLSLVAPLIDESQAFSAQVFVDLLQHVGGALVVGGVLGWLFSLYLTSGDARPKPPLATFLFAYILLVLVERLHVELLLAGVSAGFVIENLSAAGDRMIRGIESVSVVIFAFFFAIAGASLDLGAIETFWLAALILFTARLLFTWVGATWGPRLAGASEEIQSLTWQGMISQGGVTLGLVILIKESFPAIGDGIVALAMTVIIGNILGGPIILKRALQAAEGS